MTTRRPLAQLRKLSRAPVLSYARKAADPGKPQQPPKKPSRFQSISAFLPQRFVEWVRSYLKNRLGPLHRLPSYADNVERGIYRLTAEREVRIALVGDWATGTDEACRVGENVKS